MGITAGDFDGDHKTDLNVYRPSDNTWRTEYSTAIPSTANVWGTSGDIRVPADYLGEGKAQDAVFRPSNGTWYIHDANGGPDQTTVWGQNGDIPVSADYQGLGRANIAVFRPSTSTWYILKQDSSYTATIFGQGGDTPVPGDYEGSGKANIAVFRPNTIGTWLVLKQDSSQATTSFGQTGDIPVPGDYDGDGKTDIAVVRPGTIDTFYIKNSSGTPAYTQTNWGQAGDIPVPGDYGGDGRTDIAIFRPSERNWYILNSSGSPLYITTNWGVYGDVPTELPYAIARTIRLGTSLPGDNTILAGTGPGSGAGPMNVKLGTSSGFIPLGIPKFTGGFVGAPAVATAPVQDGTFPIVYYFGTATDGAIFFQHTDNPGYWVRIFPPGSSVRCTNSPAAVIAGNPNGYLHASPGYTELTVACEGTDGALWYIHGFLQPGTEVFGGSGFYAGQWQSLGTTPGLSLIAGPAVAQVDGQLTFLALQSDHRVYSRTLTTGYVQTAFGCNGHPAIAAEGGTAFMACQGGDGALYYSMYSNGLWGAPISAGGSIIDGPGIALTTARVTFYVEGLDSNAYHTTRDLSGGSATGYSGDGGPVQFGMAATGYVATPYMPSVYELLGNSNPAELGATCMTSWGVNCATGNLTVGFDGISTPGRGIPLEFRLTYNKLTNVLDGDLGPSSWTNSYSMRVSQQLPNQMVVQQENGSSLPFYSDGLGQWIAPTRVLATLVQNVDGTFTFMRQQDLIQFHFTGFRLDRETDRNGYVTQVNRPNGILSTVVDAEGRQLTFSYDSQNRLTNVADGAGRHVGIAYHDAFGNPTDFTDVNNGVTHYGYNANNGFQNQLLTVTDPRQNLVLTTDYQCQPNVTCQTGPDQRKFLYYYSGDTTAIIDPNGVEMLASHVNSQLTKLIRGVGAPQQATWLYTRDPVTMGVTAVQDPNGNISTSTWDPNGNLLSHAEASKAAAQYTYNGFNEVLTAQDPLGVTTTFAYDGTGPNLKTRARPLVGSSPLQTQMTTYNHGDASHPEDVTSLVDADGKTWIYGHDGFGDLTSVSDPLTNTTKYGFDATTGWLTSMTTPKGNTGPTPDPTYTTNYAHNPFGDVTTTTDPLLHQTIRHYDPDRNLDTFTDGLTNVTRYTYDIYNQQTLVTRADGSLLRTGYDFNGNVLTRTDGATQSTTYGYDPLNRVISVQDPLLRVTGYGYDGASRLVSKTDPGGSCPSVGCTTYGYDPANELTSISYSGSPSSNVSNVQYDADGQRTQMTDGTTGTSSWTYDSLFRMASSKNGAGSSIGYGYDLMNRLTTLTYPGSQQVTRGYDDAGRLTSVRDWLNHTTAFHPDLNSNLVGQDYPNAKTASTTFDKADRLMGISDAPTATPNSPFAGFTYGRDNANQLSSVTSTGVPADNNTYTYYPLNQLKTVNSAVYKYDPAENLTQIKDPSVQQGFDIANEVTSNTGSPNITVVGTASGGNTLGSSVTVTLPAGVAASDQILVASTQTTGNAVTTPTGYTAIGSASSGSSGATTNLFRRTAAAGDTSVALTYSQLGAESVVVVVYRGVDTAAPVDVQSSGTGAGTTTVTAPSVTATQPGDRLVMFEGATGQLLASTWTPPGGMTDRVDQSQSLAQTSAADQVLAAGGATGTRTATFGSNAQLVGMLVALKPAPTTYGYDSRGNRTSTSLPGAATLSLTYDQANRLTGYGTNAHYTYDGDGLRMSKTVGTATEAFTWDQAQGLPVLLRDGTTSSYVSYVYGEGGMPLEQITSAGSVLYYHQDQLGSTRLLTDGTGAVVATYTYDAYGKVAANGKTGAADTPLKFAGEYTDAESGFEYLRARYFDPQTAQLLTRDPADAATRQAYSYADNNPTSCTDPSGLRYAVGQQSGGGVGPPPSGANIPLTCAPGGGQPTNYPPGNNPPPCPCPQPTEPPNAAEGATNADATDANGNGGEVANPDEWPTTPEGMNGLLGTEGQSIPDGPMTPGRGKVVWKPNENTKITFEQHPYHPNAPEWHRGPHWHLDTPGKSHQRFCPGDPIPGAGAP